MMLVWLSSHFIKLKPLTLSYPFPLLSFCPNPIYLFLSDSLPPVHGVRDLFWMPIEQYRRDGRIIRGLQRGAASFGTSTASAALELSNRLVQAIQVTPLEKRHSVCVPV